MVPHKKREEYSLEREIESEIDAIFKENSEEFPEE
jgi:hypothetical protein